MQLINLLANGRKSELSYGISAHFGNVGRLFLQTALNRNSHQKHLWHRYSFPPPPLNNVDLEEIPLKTPGAGGEPDLETWERVGTLKMPLLALAGDGAAPGTPAWAGEDEKPTLKCFMSRTGQLRCCCT